MIFIKTHFYTTSLVYFLTVLCFWHCTRCNTQLSRFVEFSVNLSSISLETSYCYREKLHRFKCPGQYKKESLRLYLGQCIDFVSSVCCACGIQFRSFYLNEIKVADKDGAFRLEETWYSQYFWTSLYYTYITKRPLYKTLLCISVIFRFTIESVNSAK